MRNPLQEQLLKAGLAKKSKLDQVAREQARQRHARTPAAPATEHADVERVRVEKIERDRALSAERNAQARLHEQRAQVRQIVELHRIKPAGEIDYRFTVDGAIKSVLVTEPVRVQLANGSLVIARHDHGFAVIPRAAAEKVQARDVSMVVVDHAAGGPEDSDSDDDYYSRFKVPDDLVW